jgi:hypothetical protein
MALLLGDGSTAKVFSMLIKATKTPVAVKVVAVDSCVAAPMQLSMTRAENRPREDVDRPD